MLSKKLRPNHMHYSIQETCVRVFSVFFHPSVSVTAVGGAEKRFRETVRIFAGKGLKLAVLESDPSLLEKHQVFCKIYKLRNSFSEANSWLAIYFGWIMWILRACIRSTSLVRREKCQIILAPNNTAPNLLPAYFSHLVTRRPLCVIVHHVDVFSENVRPNFQNIYCMYKKVGYSAVASLLKTFAFFTTIKLLKKVDACIAVSNFTAKTLANFGVPTNRIFASGNGVDLEFISQFEELEKKRYDAVFVGRIAKEKGVFDLLKAWQEVIKVKRSARLLIVGSGPEIQLVRNFVTDAGLGENVVVLGRVSDVEMYGLMKTCKVFVFPSRFEGWGLAVAEALACGLPVVCYDIPALREVFGKCKSVFLVPVGDVEKFSAATLNILCIENNEYGRLTEIARNYACHFTWDKVALKDLQVIRKLGTS
jgi:glycosyltransferase involved in cell wall biosynthesis